MNVTPQALQNVDELAWFAALIKNNNVRSYLEIGAKFGGTLQAVAEAMPEGSRVVAVDLPHGTRLWKQSGPSLINTVKNLKHNGYDAHAIWGDSTNPIVIENVRKLAPFDACLIDANHTMPYVMRDFANYGTMAKMIAFHDINWKRGQEWRGVRIDVPQFWEQVKQGRRYEECRIEEKDNGIGVIWND